MQEAHGGNNRPGDTPRLVDTQLPPLKLRGGLVRLKLGAKGKGMHPGDPSALNRSR